MLSMRLGDKRKKRRKDKVFFAGELVGINAKNFSELNNNLIN